MSMRGRICRIERGWALVWLLAVPEPDYVMWNPDGTIHSVSPFTVMPWESPQYFKAIIDFPVDAPPRLSKKVETHAGKLINLARRGALLYARDKHVSLYHQVLQEYFCAKYCSIVGIQPDLLTWLTMSAFTEVWRLWAELDEALVDKLLYILEHNDDYPRHIVAYGLGRIGDRAAVPTLLHMLSDRNASVVMQAAHALGRLEILEAVPALIDLLGAVDSWYVQKACAEALIWIGVGAAPALSKALEDNKLSLTAPARSQRSAKE
jgi:hypothetical protein